MLTRTDVKPALLVARREISDQFRDWRVIFPILGLTVFFPFLMNFTAKVALNFVAKYGASILAERLVPFLLMVVGFFPISVSLVIALDSFVGEKERGSIEPLLNSPLFDWQIYLGKLISSTIPPLLSSYLGMAVYIAGLALTHVKLPDFSVLVQVIILTTVQAVLMVSGAVIVSAQTTSVRAANLLASFIVIPSALLIQGEAIVLFWGNYSTLWWAVIGLSIFSVLLVRVGLAHFRREELLGREIDVLNLRWGWRIFKTEFKGKAQNLWGWYRVEVRRTVYELRYAILIVGLVMIASVIIGWNETSVFQFPMENVNLQSLKNNSADIARLMPQLTTGSMLAIWWQNVRVFLLALPLGMLSFGVLGVLPVFASFGIVGYLMGLLTQVGITPWVYLAGFILPHGIFEIPAALIATASILRAGMLLATPDNEKSVGQVMIEGLADWVKVMLGVVIPLLLVSAMMEAWVTPHIALMFLK
jgi:uncharacterized membrane protein SpoIIM required for sporulation/ABC-type transport system involved in multi-copper enzyme maturation permease subunit